MFEAGTRLSRSKRPTTLSTALWRPTSSRSAITSPAASNRPAAWRPPVRSKTPWPERSLSTSLGSSDGSNFGPAGSGARSRRRSSIIWVPHTPQAELASIERSGLRQGLPASSTSTWFDSTSVGSTLMRDSVSPASALMRKPRTSRAEWMMPSANSRPSASSMSAPGVRITTASGSPSRSSWRGSSVTTASGASVHSPAAKRRMRSAGAAGFAIY